MCWKYNVDPHIIYYFSDKYAKSISPKLYFLSVFCQIRPTNYKELIEIAKTRQVNLKKITRNSIWVTEEVLMVFNKFTDEDLNLLSKFNKLDQLKKLNNFDIHCLESFAKDNIKQ